MELLWPTRNPYVTQHYGAKSPRYKTYHRGIDLRVVNDPKRDIIAAQAGEVVFLDASTPFSWYTGMEKNKNFGVGSPFGKHLKIKSKMGEETYFLLYAHLEEIYVKKGDHVKAGEVLGKGGDTGNAAGAHLHFEIRKEKDSSANSLNPFPHFVSAFKNRIPEWGKEAWKWGLEHKILSDKSYFDDQISKGELTVLLHRFYKLMKEE